MKHRPPTEREQERAQRRGRTLLLTAIIFLLALAVAVQSQRSRDYKAVIYEAERHTEFFSQGEDTSAVARLIGKPDRNYWQMPHTPRHKRFWAGY